MPVVQQQHGVKTIKGLPERWGRRAYAALRAELARGHEPANRDDLRVPLDVPADFVGPLQPWYGPLERVPSRYDRFCEILDRAIDAPLPLDATDAQVVMLAERCAGECAAVPLSQFVTYASVGPCKLPTRRDAMARVCVAYGIKAPACRDDAEAVARCVDPAWWRRSLRKIHGRAFEAAAIRLGFVSSRAGAYASDETVARRRGQIERNKAALASVTLENQDGYRAALDTLASKTTANKRIRKGELMLRMSGCEDIAIEAGHVGIFVTLTAPSKYHAVLEKSGETNPKYVDALPRDVAAYLQKTWARIRTAYGKLGIRPYGFRIAEPHHDGCVHWHMILFMPRLAVEWFKYITEGYALAEDGDEPGAAARRVTFEEIDSERGSAAGYLLKYVAKNIEDDSMDSHDEVIGADGEPVKIVIDKTKRASQRVDAWAGCWGIRQFQPIGQPPVTVWRELRRVKEATIESASDHVRAAWKAAQRIEKNETDGNGEVTAVEVVQAASWSDYIRAQGGVCQGRDYRIGLAVEVGDINGRYGVREGERPVGIEDRRTLAEGRGPYQGPALFVGPGAPFPRVHSSVRHTWTRVAPEAAASSRHGVAVPWSPVNNCTEGANAPEPGWVFDVQPDPIPYVGPSIFVGPLENLSPWKDYDPLEEDRVWFADPAHENILVTVDEIAALPSIFDAARKKKAEIVWSNREVTEEMITKLKEKRRTNGNLRT
jgi:hypothetical protein